jgi:hypothetical protein
MSLLSISPSAPSSPLRIGILDTASVPLPQTHAKYGNWSTICAQHLLAGADALGLPRDRLHISKWDVVNGFGDGLGGEYPALEDVDALLVTGSRACLAFSLLPRSPAQLQDPSSPC